MTDFLVISRIVIPLTFLIAALRADAVFECDTAPRAAVHLEARGKLRGCRVCSARKRDLHDIKLILQEIVDDLDKAFDRHRLLGDDESTLRIRLAKRGLKCGALRCVGRRAVANALEFVGVEDHRQKRIVLTQNERVIEVLQNFPSRLLDLVAREDHINAGIDRFLDFERQPTRVPVKIARFALKPVKAMGVLDVEMSHRPNRLAAAGNFFVHCILLSFNRFIRYANSMHYSPASDERKYNRFKPMYIPLERGGSEDRI